MSELSIHLRKDLKLLTSDSLFIILLVALAAISFFMALAICASYVQSITFGMNVVTMASLQAAQKGALVNYWSTIGNIFMVMFLVISAMAMSVEKDSGMSRYVLTFKVRKLSFYVSKMIVVVTLVLIALFTALAAYLVVFSFMDVPMLDLGSLMASMLYPLLGMLVFASLGLALSTLATKKGAVIALAVVVFFALTMVSAMSIGLGTQAAVRNHPTAGPNNYTDFMPVEYKLLIYGNPVIIAQGTSYILGTSTGNLVLFDTAGGIALSVGFFFAFFALGLLSFSRERQEQSWLATLRGQRKRERAGPGAPPGP
jgi:ABC-type transport system involved in multi-copper enzyme maturation permease subunit